MEKDPIEVPAMRIGGGGGANLMKAASRKESGITLESI